MDHADVQRNMFKGAVQRRGRRGIRRRQPYAWLGAGALGVGLALAGAGAAHADDASANDTSRAAANSTTSAPGQPRCCGNEEPVASRDRALGSRKFLGDASRRDGLGPDRDAIGGRAHPARILGDDSDDVRSGTQRGRE